MARKGGGKSNERHGGVVIRKEEIVEARHHGGAWKVAYADFVTAMMAFFLLMWLLNATTEEQRKGLADYFSPNAVLNRASSGSGQPFGGHTAFDNGALVSDRGAVQIQLGNQPIDPEMDDGDIPTPRQQRADAPDHPPAQAQADGGGPAAQLAEDQAAGKFPDAVHSPTRAEREKAERQQLDAAANEIREAVRADPTLAGFARQLAIDLTPEGLRIQLLDEDRNPMFATGSAVPNDRARLLLQKVLPALMHLPESISLAGHTDAAPYRGVERTNWELSTERANATRRLLVDSGLPEARVRSVTGNADRDPLLPADPLAAVNRRIAIVVLRGTQSATRP
jgi:chemotaxis protein MotB